MSAQQAPMVLRVTKNKHGATGYVVAVVAEERGDRALLIEADDGDDSQSDEYARRLAACWNALEGLPTELLERHGATRSGIYKGTDELKRQRDNLLTTLKQIGEYKGEGRMGAPWQEIVASLGQMARDAVAKVEGGAA